MVAKKTIMKQEANQFVNQIPKRKGREISMDTKNLSSRQQELISANFGYIFSMVAAIGYVVVQVIINLTGPMAQHNFGQMLYVTIQASVLNFILLFAPGIFLRMVSNKVEEAEKQVQFYGYIQIAALVLLCYYAMSLVRNIYYSFVNGDPNYFLITILSAASVVSMATIAAASGAMKKGKAIGMLLKGLGIALTATSELAAIYLYIEINDLWADIYAVILMLCFVFGFFPAMLGALRHMNWKVVKGAVVGGIIAGDVGAVVGAAAAASKENAKNNNQNH